MFLFTKKRKRGRPRKKKRLLTIKLFDRLVAFALILAVDWTGLSAVTNALFFDRESALGNIFAAGTLDLTLNSTSFDFGTVGPNDVAVQNATVGKNGGENFKYIVKAKDLTGDADFCASLHIVAENNSVSENGPLSAFASSEKNYNAAATGWKFSLNTPAVYTSDKTCNFKLVFTGYLIDPATGFTDSEEINSVIKYHPSSACAPQNVSLPSTFDSAYWISQAQAGGSVGGSFAFPAATTNLILGPTEIKGDLTFGLNNAATINGPIYVDENLTIGAGTVITQGSNFGNKIVPIIVNGTITIGDNVVFNGSTADANKGVILLVANDALAAPIAIDVAAHTAGTGDLGDVALFAKAGNIHLGAGRTVLNAFVTTTSSSGNTDFLSPTANANSGWTNPTDGYTANDIRAYADSSSDIVQYYNFGFSVPASSNITGIQVQTEGYNSGSRQAEVSLSWNNGTSYTTGSGTGLKTTTYPTDTTSPYSDDSGLSVSSTDTWGRSWTVSELANLRVKLDATSGNSSILYVDQVSVKVYYTTAGQTITKDSGAVILGAALPAQAACGPKFTPEKQVFINEFVPNVADTAIITDTGVKTPILSDGSGFTNPDRAFVADNSYATGTRNSSQKYANFGITLPSIATINGIEVSVEGYKEQSSSVNKSFDASLSWNNGSYTAAKNTGDMGNTQDKIVILGSPTDTWGRTWSASELNNNNFRLNITAIFAQNATAPLDLDNVTLKVYYSLPAGSFATGLTSPSAVNPVSGQWTNPANAYANDSAVATDAGAHQQQYYNLPLSAPAQATIDGIEINADAWSTVAPLNTGLISPTSQAATTGGSGNGFEVSPQNALTDGNGNAANMNGAGDKHIFGGYNFGNLTGATINGIQVRLDWWLDSSLSSNSMSVELSWNGGTTWTSALSTTNEPTTETTSLLGDSSTTWGHVWTASDFDNFKVRLTSNSGSSSRDFYLDWIPVTISYTPSNSGCLLRTDLSWNGGASWTSAKDQVLTGTSPASPYYTIGGSADTWGHAWTPAELANFRIRVQDVDPGSDCADTAVANLDSLQANVHYSINGDAGNAGLPNDGEWIELYNGKDSDVDATGWSLRDFNGGVLPITKDNTVNTGYAGTLTIKTHGYLVVYRDGDVDFDLDNTDDTIYLNNGSADIDTVHYTYAGGAPVDKSFARIPDGSTNWIDPEATPGEPNNMFIVPYVPEVVEVLPVIDPIVEILDPVAEAKTASTTEETAGDANPETSAPITDTCPIDGPALDDAAADSPQTNGAALAAAATDAPQAVSLDEGSANNAMPAEGAQTDTVSPDTNATPEGSKTADSGESNDPSLKATNEPIAGIDSVEAAPVTDVADQAVQDSSETGEAGVKTALPAENSDNANHPGDGVQSNLSDPAVIEEQTAAIIGAVPNVGPGGKDGSMGATNDPDTTTDSGANSGADATAGQINE